MKPTVTLKKFASLLLWPALAVQAQGVGVASLGASGGLQIPSAYVLDEAEAAFSFGNYQDPKLGSYSRKQNYSVGFGLGGGVELFGRVAEYQNPRPTAPWATDVNGPRDISVNLKWQLPLAAPGLPKLALGFTDPNGAAVYFKSVYAVASDEVGPLRWSLGYAHGWPALARSNGAKVLNGAFGGAELRLWQSPVTALLETDGSQRHAGVRYYSAAIPWLGNAQLVGSAQRSFGATNLQGRDADATSFNVTLVLPLQTSDATRHQRARSAAQALPPLPALAAPVDPASAASAASASADPADALAPLLRSLRAAGLERVRVGTLNGDLVVEYENQRYLHNEVDALGVLLGLAAELAPAGTRRVNAITLKLGQVVYETSVNVAALRAYLRQGDASAVLASLGSGHLSGYDAAAVQWAGGTVRPSTRLRVTLTPLLNDTIGTEYGFFDYSLALQARLSTPLWRGAQAYADLVQPLAHSSNMDSGRVFASSLHQSGLQTLALQQSFWLGPRLLNSVGVGRYQYGALGADGESILFAPWRDDTIHLRGQFSRSTEAGVARTVQASSASYRWHISPAAWLEGGLNEYTDGSRGPSAVFTRWFGDVALQMSLRKGGNNSFVGLSLSLPLGPRQGMAAAPLQVAASPRFGTGLRTLLTTGGNSTSYVRPGAVRPAEPSYQAELELLNAGRLTPDYLRSQLPRLRESFYLFGRDLLP